MDPEVLAAWIQGISGIIAAVIAAAAAAYIGQKISRRKDLEEDLARAKSDIEFLLWVESEHCAHHRLRGESTSLKITMRSKAMKNGRTWSGRFTPGRNRQSAP